MKLQQLEKNHSLLKQRLFSNRTYFGWLRSCPFCRSDYVHVGDNRKSIFVECEKCGARPYEIDYCVEPEERQEWEMSSTDAEKEVIKMWNRRISWLGNLLLRIQRGIA